MKDKDIVLRIILLLFLIIGMYSFILIKQYEYVKIKKEDLEYIKIDFDYFTEGPNSKYKKRYIVYSIDGKKYGFGSIVGYNQELIEKIQKGSEVEIYYRNTKEKYYKYEIIEMYYNNESIITIQDYYEDYSKHIKISIIILIGLIIFIVPLIIYLPKLIDIIDKKSKKNNYRRKTL